MRVLFLLLVLVSTAAAAEVAPVTWFTCDTDSDATTRGTSIDPSNITTVNTAAKYTDPVFIGDGEYFSVSITIDTTETVSVAVEVQNRIVDVDGTVTWASFNPAVKRTFTADTTETWAIGPCPCDGGVIRLKFPADTVKPMSQYEIERCKLNRWRP